MATFSKKFASASVEWTTPTELFAKLDVEFGFTLDVAATAENAKCSKYFTKEIDGLLQTWSGVCWMNPPYGRGMSDWLLKAILEARDNGVTTVALIPARTNTGWWHDLCVKFGEIRFVRGRPKFGGSKHGLPQPLAIVIFRKGYDKHKRAVEIGRIGGSKTSAAKKAAVQQNGKLGGRPKKITPEAPVVS